MSDKWTTYFARANKVYIEPPQCLDKKYDDLLLSIIGNLTHEDRMKAAKELCDLFNGSTDTQEVEQLRKENGLLREGMKGDYDLDACLDWAEAAERLSKELEKWKREALQQYPTPEAYDAVCNALNKHRRERDELAAYVERSHEELMVKIEFGLSFALCHKDFVSTRNAIKKMQNDLSAIMAEFPSTSLQQHDNGVIEKCTEHGLEQLKHMSPTLAVESVRSLKDKT
jgi:hypothetical protein